MLYSSFLALAEKTVWCAPGTCAVCTMQSVRTQQVRCCFRRFRRFYCRRHCCCDVTRARTRACKHGTANPPVHGIVRAFDRVVSASTIRPGRRKGTHEQGRHRHTKARETQRFGHHEFGASGYIRYDRRHRGGGSHTSEELRKKEKEQQVWSMMYECP